MSDTPRASISTILFTDLVGSTELMQRVGDESAHRLFQAHHELLSNAVAATGGSELQWLGDGLMVAFGSTADAVRCAITMQQAAASGIVGGERLAVRVGLNTGEILRQTSATGSGYFGTPVVIARRLCDRAEAGQILCTSTVSGLLAGRAAFRFRELGPAELKGLADSVGVCQVVYDAGPGTALLAHTPFVGRERELARLAGQLDAARAGRGGLAMLVGEPGIGKTRTLEELAARARREDAAVLWGRCFEGEGAAPFAPFAEAFADHAEESHPDLLEKVLGRYGPALSVMVPALRARIPTLAEPAALEPNEERQRLFDAVAQVLLALSERAPVLLVLDDLHWADAGTIAMLRHVARFAARGRLLLVGAYRDVELDRQHPLAGALAGLKRETEYERVALKGLAEAEVGRLLETIAAHEVPAALVHAIHTETEGNPFFVREVLLHLVEAGKLYRAEGRWRSDYSIEEMGIPEGVRQVIGRRLSRLSDEANRLLSAASGFQGAFRFEVAAGAGGLAEDAALDALDEALEAQLVRPTGEAEVYDFTHALIRHALYTEMSPSRQVRLHRRLAEEMERVLGERVAEHAEAIAQQWHRSAALPGAERGVAHCLAAAERAERAAAHEQAAAALRMALDLLPPGDARRPRVLARLGLSLGWSLALEDAVATASEAGELIAETESGDAAADYLCEATEAVWGAGFSHLAWRLAEQGLRHIGARRDVTWALLVLRDLSRREAEDPDFPGIPIEHPDRRAAARRIVQHQSEVDLGSDLWWMLYAAFDSREEATRSSVVFHQYFSRMASPRGLAQWLGPAIAEALERGRIAAAALAVILLTRAQIAAGELAAGSETFAQAVELAGRVPQSRWLALQLGVVPFIFAISRGEGFEPLLAGIQAIRGEDAPENRWVRATWQAVEADLLARLGRAEEAERALEALLPAIERAPGWAPNYPALLFLASITLWTLGRRDLAEVIERNLRAKWLAPGWSYLEADVRFALGLLCGLQERGDEASQWFAKARFVLEEESKRVFRAQVDLYEAHMFVRRAAPGDRERALPLLDAALRQFEAIGMPGWIRRAEELRRELGE
jgi:class 3 adenylate cyclase/tetratricopeptide (TPR) repeat protein